MRPTIMLRSSWQTVNIGDVAHSPGALRAFTLWAADASVILWPMNLGTREHEMISREFPDVRIVQGDLRADGSATTSELADALAVADVLVHGSAPGLVCPGDLQVWAASTGKPYGFFGVSLDPLNPQFTGSLEEIECMVRQLPQGALDPAIHTLLDGSAFFFCRDSITALFLQSQGIRAPILEFGPDATFAFDTFDEGSASQIKRDYELEDGNYLCVVPRVRWTPYFRIRDIPPTAEDSKREAYNSMWTEHDMGVLRAAILAYVRRTGGRVLVGPEMSYAVDLAREHFTDTLPADVRDRVHVLPRFWEASEAITIYRDAAAVLSIECHSPIMSASQGTPAIYLRQPTDTLKGRMFADLGIPERTVEIAVGAPEVLSQLHRILDDPAGAREITMAAAHRATDLLKRMCRTVLAVAGNAAASRQLVSRSIQQLNETPDETPNQADASAFAPQTRS